MANRFIDITKSTGTLTGTVTFTNGSTTVTGSGTSFTTELAVGNYIKVSTGTEWYRVTSIESDTSLTLSWAFAQATITDAADSTPYNAEDGTSTTNAFCHLRQATTDEVRAAGDIIHLRRGQTHLYEAVDIVLDEDGQPNNYITLMGDDGTGWSGETGLAQPVIRFNGSSYKLNLNADNFWKLKDLGIKEGGYSYGVLFVTNCQGIVVEDSLIHDNIYPTRPRYSTIKFKNCTFKDKGYIESYYGNYLIFEDCTFTAGTIAPQPYGLVLRYPTIVELSNCKFGYPEAHGTADIYFDSIGSSIVRGRNVLLNSATEVGFANPTPESKALIEDKDEIKLANKGYFWNGTIERDTTVVRTGGASSSARMESNSNCGTEQPLNLCGLTEESSRWLTAGSRSCTIYLRGSGWTALPTASELYIEVLYYDGTSAKRAKVTSTDVLTANDTWTAFTVNFTLNSDSPCYANVVLKKYEAGAKVYVDILPEWS